MKIETHDNLTREEWLELRRQDITASSATALLGAHPYTSAYQLWAEKTGKVDDQEENAVMRRGRLLEPVVAEMLAEEKPEWGVIYDRANKYFRAPELRLGATPDCFAHRPDKEIEEETGIVQFKTTSDYSFRKNWIDPDTNDVIVPLWIAVQAIIEARLTDSRWAAVAVLTVGHGINLHVIDIPLHEGVFDRVVTETKSFWDLVGKGEHPPIDWKKDGRMVLDVYRETDGAEAEIDDPAAFNGLISRYSAAKARERDAKQEADLVRPQIIEALGNAEMAETQEFRVSAKTQHRKPYTVTPKPMRVIRITDKREKEAAE